jgi:hypothetical protein
MRDAHEKGDDQKLKPTINLGLKDSLTWSEQQQSVSPLTPRKLIREISTKTYDQYSKLLEPQKVLANRTLSFSTSSWEDDPFVEDSAQTETLEEELSFDDENIELDDEPILDEEDEATIEEENRCKAAAPSPKEGGSKQELFNEIFREASSKPHLATLKRSDRIYAALIQICSQVYEDSDTHVKELK